MEDLSVALHNYKAKLVNVVDGDTFDVLIDLGFDITVKQRVRLYGVDCPEMNSPNEETRKGAAAAKEFVQEIMDQFPDVICKTMKPKDKYGRYLARVFFYNGVEPISIGAELFKAGHCESLVKPELL